MSEQCVWAGERSNGNYRIIPQRQIDNIIRWHEANGWEVLLMDGTSLDFIRLAPYEDGLAAWEQVTRWESEG